MMLNKYIAIDFGSSKISALSAEVNPDRTLNVLAYETKPSDDVKYGIISQVSGAAFKMSELLKLIQNSSKINDISQVSVSIGAKSMKVVKVGVHKYVGASATVSEALMEDLLKECEQKVAKEKIAVFDITPLYYELDGRRTDEPLNKNAKQISAFYTVVYGHSMISDGIDRCMDRTGILVEHSSVSVEALSAAVLDEKQREDGCALINFGASTTTLAIYKNDILQQMIVVPLGGINITKDIEELGISRQYAERLKCVTGFALESKVDKPVLVEIPSVDPDKSHVQISTQFLATIIESRIEEIIQPLLDAISDYDEILDAGIVITGNGSKMKCLVELIAEKSGLNVQIGDHTEWLSEKTDKRYSDTSYSQLIGTIILNHEHRLINPAEVEVVSKKGLKLPKGKLRDRIDNFIGTFFGEDDNKMDQMSSQKDVHNTKTEK
jgi:cell division protein FtsA